MDWQNINPQRAAAILRPWAAALEGRISDPVLQQYISALLEDLERGVNENLIPREERWLRGDRYTAQVLVDSIATAYRRAVEPAVPPAAPISAPGAAVGSVVENWIKRQVMLDLEYGRGLGGAWAQTRTAAGQA